MWDSAWAVDSGQWAELRLSGLIGWHGYNEPTLQGDRMLRLMDRISEGAPDSRFLLWTNNVVPASEQAVIQMTGGTLVLDAGLSVAVTGPLMIQATSPCTVQTNSGASITRQTAVCRRRRGAGQRLHNV